MVIFKFIGQTFLEIPQDKNPALIKKEEWKTPYLQCLIICKQIERTPPYVNSGKYCVLLITANNNPKEEDTVCQVGLFWEVNDAEMFAEAYRKKLLSTWHGVKLRKGVYIRVTRLFGHIAVGFERTIGKKFFNVGYRYKLSEDYIGDRRLFIEGMNDVWWTSEKATVEFEPCHTLGDWHANKI